MGRSALRLGALISTLLALTACAVQAPPAATPVATAPPVSLDQDFLNRAATGTSTQVELGRLARERAVHPAVRAFGSHIAGEHARAHTRLTALAQRMAMLPNPTNPDLSRLAALSGPEFDRQFMADQIVDQREALALFDTEAQTGQAPPLRRFAREWVPTLRRDLQQAEQLAARVGG